MQFNIEHTLLKSGSFSSDFFCELLVVPIHTWTEFFSACIFIVYKLKAFWVFEPLCSLSTIELTLWSRQNWLCWNSYPNLPVREFHLTFLFYSEKCENDKARVLVHCMWGKNRFVTFYNYKYFILVFMFIVLPNLLIVQVSSCSNGILDEAQRMEACTVLSVGQGPEAFSGDIRRFAVSLF